MQQLSRSIHLSLHIHKDPDAMAERAAHILAAACDEAVSERGVFRMAISGGKTPLPLFRLLSRKDWTDALPWDKISVFWADERCCSPDDPASNYGNAHKELLSYVPCTSYYRMRGDLDPEKAALEYEQTLRKEFMLKEGEIPRFDMILLGMGEDGHTASLFPNSPALYTRDRLVIDQYVPERGGDRLTLTLPVLNNSRCCLFMVTGKEKHSVLHRALNLLDKPELPAQLVHPPVGDLIWVVDENAATGGK
ncbi:MAG: 6-phosphogluconolactonase [Desulfovibrionaceae bacterium]|nr:6-phosphogluconolactonase [Desulfovibrionaceae bacterium]